ncbi:hypothetical protein [Absidia glauca]|uniref:Uncharacterized protein n=1 Tax=Absidia glauca TaxID=4829 RepID=A0A163JF13_ABSGL|nr:hypothetical protein [Absidia glauca]
MRRLDHIQKTLKCDLRQWSSRHRYRRHRYRRRHRRSESKDEKKMKDVKIIVSHGKQEMKRMLRRGRVLPFVRRRSSFVVIVRSAMIKWRWKNKSGEEAKKKQ